MANPEVLSPEILTEVFFTERIRLAHNWKRAIQQLSLQGRIRIPGSESSAAIVAHTCVDITNYFAAFAHQEFGVTVFRIDTPSTVCPSSGHTLLGVSYKNTLGAYDFSPQQTYSFYNQPLEMTVTTGFMRTETALLAVLRDSYQAKDHDLVYPSRWSGSLYELPIHTNLEHLQDTAEHAIMSNVFY